ncbi:chromatin assembly factor 1 subunit A [Orussus abietinus]|uniref:chromatin assembly factor 1 subunit A n=1 Tax=Orussus abietinus TaxID=222816 RepID=UPI000626CE57|nr:chromatin assembly factor 1 subunit A [Orussus abietinus]
MKIMDVSMKEEDCTIVQVTPPKTKKLKQARLPFKMISSIESSNSTSNKKRKFSSPSPTQCRSPKLVKINTKENSSDKIKKSEPDVSEVNRTESEEDNKALNDTKVTEVVDKSKEENEKRRSGSSKVKDVKSKKSDVKESMQHGALNRFLKKTDEKDDGVDTLSKSTITSKCASTVSDDDENKSDGEILHIEGVQDDSIELITESESIHEESLSVADKSSPIGSEQEVSEVHQEVTVLSSDDELDKSCNESDVKNTPTSQANINKTPKRNRTSFTKEKKLTPKQLEKRQEIAKRREEKERLKMEKDKKREEERESRKREKEEKRKEREEKERLEKEQKRKEKELKEMKKQMEIEQKQKEKEAKEEDRRKREEAKEEEKRRKEEEKLEAERKKQKVASTFVSFFVPKKLEAKPTLEEEAVVKVSNFMPFEVKADMRVAPVTRRKLSKEDRSKFDELCNEGNELTKLELYLAEIKSKTRQTLKCGKTWPAEAKDDVIIIDEEDDDTSNIVDQNTLTIDKHRPKLLTFTENRRPPYWGTWRKKSNRISARRPFTRDTKWFDYDVDSDEEWEEEEPGESLRGSDDERDDENADDDEYDVDNEFMVPHGYLSDEEAKADEEDSEDMSPETQKVKLKLLGEEFEAERNEKTAKIKPKVIGCIWQDAEGRYPKNTTSHVVQFLTAHQVWVRELPVVLRPAAGNENQTGLEGDALSQKQPGSSGPKKKKVPEEAMPDLIRLIHGNTHGRGFLVKEFMTFWNKKNKPGEQQISKASLLQKIREIGRWMACPEQGPLHLKACWYVSEDARKEYGLEDITIPNRWSYILTPKRRSEVEVPEKHEKEKDDKEKKRIPLITQFTKKVSQDDRKRPNLEMQPRVVLTKLIPTQAKPPKRATLISVARGENFPKTSTDNTIMKFITTCSPSNKTVDKVPTVQDDSDEVMILDEIKNVNEKPAENIQSSKEKDATSASMEIDQEEGSEDKIAHLDTSAGKSSNGVPIVKHDSKEVINGEEKKERSGVKNEGELKMSEGGQGAFVNGK